MSVVEPTQKLREAIDRLRNEIDCVEFWADAVERLAQPIPEYAASDEITRHLLPAHKVRDTASRKH